jgi:CelD/BcsL family acetyltransferase involved in cellulose biosynthesis
VRGQVLHYYIYGQGKGVAAKVKVSETFENDSHQVNLKWSNESMLRRSPTKRQKKEMRSLDEAKRNPG